jgi:spore coat protein CotF
MDDKLYMENYLLLLKSTMEVYVHGTLESSNPDIRNVLKMGLDETVSHQARTYDEMTKYGWYNINNVKSNIIKQTISTIKNGN